jgi:hypothetical protein
MINIFPTRQVLPVPYLRNNPLGFTGFFLPPRFQLEETIPAQTILKLLRQANPVFFR